jgi:hypothetical protein
MQAGAHGGWGPWTAKRPEDSGPGTHAGLRSCLGKLWDSEFDPSGNYVPGIVLDLCLTLISLSVKWE